MQLKPEVKTTGTTPELWYGLGVAETIHSRLFAEPLIITSMNDGQHTEGSLHYKGRAADVRTQDLTPLAHTQFYTELLKALYALGFDVVDEHTHIHIEYDPKPHRVVTTDLPTGA